MGVEVCQDGKDAAVVVWRLRKLERGKDACHMFLYGVLADEEALSYGFVGTALGHQRQHLALTLG